MIKKIAIVVAMQSEFDLVSHIIEKGQKETINGSPAITGMIGNKSIILIKSGIGKVNAGVQVSELIAKEHPDAIINSGVAGGIGKGIHQADIVVGAQCVYHDVWCGEGEWGQVQGFPLKFEADSHLLDSMKSLGLSNIHYGLICTGDQFISELDRLKEIKQRFPDGLAVDMESCAMAQVCHMRKTPFMSIRIISDTPGMEHDNTSQYFDFFKEAPKKTFSVLLQLIERV